MCSNGRKINSIHSSLKIDDEETMEKEMLKPFNYHIADLNHNLKQDLFKLLGRHLNIPEDKLEILTKILNYIYNSILLFKDIKDSLILRQGKPTAHKIFGYPKTILANNWIYASIFKTFEKLDNIEVARLFFNTLPKILAGQGLETYWSENNICPTELDYLKMIDLKVSQVFLLLGKLMCVFSTTHKHLSIEKLLTTLGIHFQIQEDYKNLCDLMYFEGLSERKLGFPLVHAINNFPEEGKMIQDILQQRIDDVKEKQRCLSILEKCGSFEYTEKKLQELKKVIFEEVKKLDENSALTQFLMATLHAYL